MSTENEGEVTEEGIIREPGLQDEEASILSDVPSEDEEPPSEVAKEDEAKQHVQDFSLVAALRYRYNALGFPGCPPPLFAQAVAAASC